MSSQDHLSLPVVALTVAHLMSACSQTDGVNSETAGATNGMGTAGAPGLGEPVGDGSGGADGSMAEPGPSGPAVGPSVGPSAGAPTSGAPTGGGGPSTGGAPAASPSLDDPAPGGGGFSTGGAPAGGGGSSTGGAPAGGASAGQGGTDANGGAGLGGLGGSSGSSGTAGSGGAGSGMSSGCGKAPTLMSGNQTMQSAGQSRSYILRIPANYDNSRPYRLVFAYHWRGGTMQDVDGGGSSGAAWSYYGLQEQADDSTIFVAPQGIGNGWPNSGGQDLEFTDDMLELIQGDLCVNTRQVFALGFSYGGGMSYSLACARPNVFRAVAVYSGGVLSGCDGGTQPVAYLGIHGLGDDVLNISGGRSMRDRFVENNGCTSQNPPEPNGGSLMHTCTTYEGCTAGYPVRWCAFDGGHTPGMVDGGGDDGARTWTKGEAWEFFSQFE